MLRILRLPLTLERTGKKRSNLYDSIKKGTFVPPVKISDRAGGWPENEVEAVVAAQIAGQSDDEIRALVKQLVEQRKFATTGLIAKAPAPSAPEPAVAPAKPAAQRWPSASAARVVPAP